MAAIFLEFVLRGVAFFAPISISLTQILYGVLAVYAIYFISKGGWRTALVENSGTKYIPYMLALMVMVFITSLLGDDPARSFKKYKQVILPLTFFIGYYFCRQPKSIIFWAMAGGALSTIGGVVRFMMNIGTTDRISGFYSSPVRYGNIMAFIAILGVCVFVYKLYRSDRERNFYIVFTILSIVGMLASTTRGAILAFLVALTILFIIKYRLKGLAMMLGVVATLTIIVMLVPVLKMKTLEAIHQWDNPYSSFGWRFILWKESWRVFLENPWTGVGVNNIKPYFEELIKGYPGQGMSIAHSHSNYFQTLVDYGIFGVLVLGALFGKLFKDQLYGTIRNNYFGIMGLLLLVVLAVQGISESSLFDSEICMFFWLMCGTLLGAQHRTMNSSKKEGYL